jgi:putative flippase GtrA
MSAGLGLLVDVTVYFITFTYIIEKRGVALFNYQTSAHEFSLFISYSTGVTANFLLTKYAVFSESTVASRKQFFRFALIAGIGFFANYTLLRFFVEIVGIVPILSRITSALSLGFASYYVHKLFTFKVTG